MKKVKDRETSAPLCACRLLEAELDKREKADPLKLAELRRKTWPMCWKCQLFTTGCPTCSPWPSFDEYEARVSKAVCPRCGVYTVGDGFLLWGNRLPPQEFDSYPGGWQLEYWAIYGAPDRRFLPSIRHQLRGVEHSLKRVNRVLRHLGKPEYTVDAVTGEIVAPIE